MTEDYSGQRILICTVGLPRSGKSTWARKQGLPIVNPDAVRLAVYGQRFWGPGEKLVWVHAWYMVRSLFVAGHDRVIVDATNIKRKHRDAWVSEDWMTAFKYFDTSEEECLRRAAKDPVIRPIIERMRGERELLWQDELKYEEVKKIMG